MRTGLVVVAALLLAAVLVSGCAFMAGAAVAGAATYVYKEGELTKTYPKPYEEVRLAVIEAMQDDMDYMIVERAGDKIKAKAPGDKDITVDLSYTGSNVTKVGIRVGLLGDEDHSQEIMNRIDRRLE